MADPIVKHQGEELDLSEMERESSLDTALSPSQNNTLEIGPDELSDLTDSTLQTSHTIQRKRASQPDLDVSRLQKQPHLSSLEVLPESPEAPNSVEEVSLSPTKIRGNSLLDQLMKLVVLFLEKIEALLIGTESENMKQQQGTQEDEEYDPETVFTNPSNFTKSHIGNRLKKKRRFLFRRYTARQ